jgi:hypothetical protein
VVEKINIDELANLAQQLYIKRKTTSLNGIKLIHIICKDLGKIFYNENCNLIIVQKYGKLGYFKSYPDSRKKSFLTNDVLSNYKINNKVYQELKNELIIKKRRVN